MKLWRHWRKKGQTGQSLIILAVGFLALLGFVGIVTDVSVLFIRYSTMRRAIDAAAIAAAGQMRRVVDDPSSPAPASGAATSIANLNLAARQFIEVYGLDPKNVIVETCRSQEVAYDADGNAYDAPLYLDPPTNLIPNPNTHRLFIVVPNDPLVPTGPTHNEVNPAADPAVVARYQELCTKDELKLVRVTAQIDAPTIFLRLLGYPTITLTESAISQTAVIDVVLIFDVSESMLNETTYDDWDHVLNMTTADPTDEIKLGVRYVPPLIGRTTFDTNEDPDPAARHNDPWAQINGNTEHTLNNRILRTLTTLDNDFRDQTVAFEPTTDLVNYPSGFRTVTMPIGGTTPEGRQEPREFCQVRAFVPTIWYKSPVEPDLYAEYSAYFAGIGGDVNNEVYSHAGSPYYMGFVPMYNYFGCCNDPDGLLDANGNMDFSDLVCQPFQKARNAADSFLSQLDFLRGDRVALVTFDRRANPIDPDGSVGSQAYMIETEHNLADPSDPTGKTLLRKGAVETLHQTVGVRAEYSSYADRNGDGLWDALIDGTEQLSVPRTYDGFLNDVAIDDIVSNPVDGSCPYDRATLDPQWLDAAGKWKPNGDDRLTALLDDVVTTPDWAIAAGANLRFNSYELRASCAGTNMGGALAAGSSVLYSEGRREGAVWIMVLLSDGAAGASNPVTRIGSDDVISQPDPYVKIASAAPGNPLVPAYVYDPQPGVGGPVWNSATGAAGYGAFGLCPYGSNDPLAAVDDPGPSQLASNRDFPVCSDLHPEYRHYCGTTAIMPDDALKPADETCIDYYNVDDYARDWADCVGVAELPDAVGCTRFGDELLPTIFTIGFGLNYDTVTDPVTGVTTHTVCDPSDYDCIRGITRGGAGDNYTLQRLRSADYLGEELLRYIADVGDNFQIDSDYWQQDMGSRIGNGINPSLPEWGQRGPCEEPYTGPLNGNGNTYDPKPPRQSCGNFFVASSGSELEQVFNEIASRMFTRLSQ